MLDSHGARVRREVKMEFLHLPNYFPTEKKRKEKKRILSPHGKKDKKNSFTFYNAFYGI
jgi:hypothetical protein